MDAEGRKTSRRALLKYALGTFGLLAAPGADVSEVALAGRSTYQVIDQRELLGGGIGLFLAVPPTISREGLKALGQQLRQQFRTQPEVVAEVFDDGEAAQTVRTGSRVVGEARFETALAHQRASYYKNTRIGRNTFTLLDPPKETISY